MLASQLGGYGAYTGLCALPHASLGASPNLATFPWYMLDVLHWLPLQQRISYRIISLVWRSLLGLAPAYLRDLCHTTMGIPGRRSLRSTEQVLLLVPFATLQLCRIAPSQLLAPRFGMGYLWRSDCSLGLSLTPFTPI